MPDNVVRLRFDEQLPAFPVDALPEAARGYCEFLSEGGIPLEFLGPTALTMLSAAIGGLVNIQIGDDYWNEPMMLWTLTVGVTGSGKSPAVKNLRSALDEVESPWRLQYRNALLEWEALPRKEREGQPKPQCRRMVISDFTFEKLIRILNEDANHAGLLLVADEFASFVRGLSQYKNGQGSDRANFLTIWNATPFSYDRVKDDVSIWIQHPVVNIVGGTQPHLLGALTGDDGFRDRFLVSVYDKPVAEEHPMVKASGQAQRWKVLVRSLAERRDVSRTRVFTPAALEQWVALRRQYIRIQNNPETPPHLRNWTAKASSHLARLALLLSEADRHGDVDEHYLERAVQLVNYFGRHYRHLDLDEPNPMLPRHRQGEDAAVRAIADFARKCQNRVATRRQLQRARVGGIRTAPELDLAIKRYGETYEDHVFEETPPGGGPMTTVVYAPGHSPDAGGSS